MDSMEATVPGPVPADINARFDAKTQVAETGCLVWTSASDKDGYGLFQVSGRVTVRAHRWAYERAHGPLQKGQIVRHSCDHPACVNPEHLIAGTARENMQDMAQRGRDAARRTTGHHAAKMTQEKVDELLRRRANGESIYQMYREFGISYGHAKNLCAGRRWKVSPNVPLQ
jgi:hypothetical protein